MAEPSAAVGMTIAAHSVGAATLTFFGVNVGLQADLLLAGFAGAATAMAYLNTVPSTGDTLRELVRTSGRRVAVAITGAAMAAYTAPLLALLANIPIVTMPERWVEVITRGVAFVIGAGAQQLLPKLIRRLDPRPPKSQPPQEGSQ